MTTIHLLAIKLEIGGEFPTPIKKHGENPLVLMASG
jgi:hypothetical protein